MPRAKSEEDQRIGSTLRVGRDKMPRVANRRERRLGSTWLCGDLMRTTGVPRPVLATTAWAWTARRVALWRWHCACMTSRHASTTGIQA